MTPLPCALLAARGWCSAPLARAPMPDRGSGDASAIRGARERGRSTQPADQRLRLLDLAGRPMPRGVSPSRRRSAAPARAAWAGGARTEERGDDRQVAHGVPEEAPALADRCDEH